MGLFRNCEAIIKGEESVIKGGFKLTGIVVLFCFSVVNILKHLFANNYMSFPHSPFQMNLSQAGMFVIGTLTIGGISDLISGLVVDTAASCGAKIVEFGQSTYNKVRNCFGLRNARDDNRFNDQVSRVFDAVLNALNQHEIIRLNHSLANKDQEIQRLFDLTTTKDQQIAQLTEQNQSLKIENRELMNRFHLLSQSLNLVQDAPPSYVVASIANNNEQTDEKKHQDNELRNRLASNNAQQGRF